MINVSDQIVDIPYNRVNVHVSLFPPNMPPDCTLSALTLIRLSLSLSLSSHRFTVNPFYGLGCSTRVLIAGISVVFNPVGQSRKPDPNKCRRGRASER